MVAALEVLPELLRRERVAALGRFMGGLCHELSNPLAFILSNSENLAEYAADLTKLIHAYREKLVKAGLLDASLLKLERDIDVEFLLEDAVRAAVDASQGARRLRELITAVRSYAAIEEGPVVDVDLGKAMGQAMAIMSKALRERVVVKLDIPANLQVKGRVPSLTQVVVALLTNSLDAGARHVELSAAPSPGGATLVVSDDGPGVPENLRATVFEPFFTTRPGDALGLGLAVARRLAQAMGGALHLEPSDTGARFVLTLAV